MGKGMGMGMGIGVGEGEGKGWGGTYAGSLYPFVIFASPVSHPCNVRPIHVPSSDQITRNGAGGRKIMESAVD